jgi:hypothetical protein
MSEHFAAWERLMQGWSKQGWEWHNIITPDYCVVATEVWSSDSANTSVSNINFSGVGTLANSTFSGAGDGDAATGGQTGDSRGFYYDAPVYGATFYTMYAELPVDLVFGDIMTDGTRNSDGTFKTKIGLIIVQDFYMQHVKADGTKTDIRIPVITFKGQADISGKKITADKSASTVSTNVKHFEITKEDNNTLSFTYQFDGDNAYEGWGAVTRDGASSGARSARSVAVTPSAAVPSANLAAILAALKPKNLPITPIAKIGSGSANLTVTAARSAYSVQSGQYNGVVQLQFTNPSSPKVEQIEVVVISPVGSQKVYDFKASDSNPNYWGWGGQIQLPKADTRYSLVIRKYVSNPVSFTLRAW